eukprot:6182743-Karenia_brevis.AAC.1
MYQLGPGGYKIMLSPGTRTYELEESHAGHLMLPCSRFQGPVKHLTEFLANTIEDKPPTSHTVISEPAAMGSSGSGL